MAYPTATPDVPLAYAARRATAEQEDGEEEDEVAQDPPLPDMPGEGEEDDLSWIDVYLARMPVGKLHPDLCASASRILKEDWHKRLPKRTWGKIMKRTQGPIPRLLKELNETAPVIARTMDFVERQFPKNPLGKEDQRFTIVDLGCGLGFMSMFLSEMLPREKVKEIFMVDRMWPQVGVESTKTDGVHMTRDHIDLGGYSIPLKTLKIDLKKGRDLADLCHYVFQNGNREERGTGNRIGAKVPAERQPRIIMLGVHLCGSLSLRAADLVNRNTASVEFACIKPCCLPGKLHLRTEVSYSVGGHSFTAEELYFPGGEGRPHLYHAEAEKQLTDSEEEGKNPEANCTRWDRDEDVAPARPKKAPAAAAAKGAEAALQYRDVVFRGLPADPALYRKVVFGAKAESGAAAGDAAKKAKPPTGRGKLRFRTWCEQIYKCLEVPAEAAAPQDADAERELFCVECLEAPDAARKSHEYIKVQRTYFQNRFLFYERLPRESDATFNEGLTTLVDGGVHNMLLQNKHQRQVEVKLAKKLARAKARAAS